MASQPTNNVRDEFMSKYSTISMVLCFNLSIGSLVVRLMSMAFQIDRAGRCISVRSLLSDIGLQYASNAPQI